MVIPRTADRRGHSDSLSEQFLIKPHTMQTQLATEWMAQKLAEIGINVPPSILSEANTRECWNIADGFEDGHLAKIQNITIGETAYDYLGEKFNCQPSIL